MKVNRDQGATVEFCHPEGCSTARRIWLVLKTSTPRSLGHEAGLGMTLFFLSSRASEATEGSALAVILSEALAQHPRRGRISGLPLGWLFVIPSERSD